MISFKVKKVFSDSFIVSLKHIAKVTLFSSRRETNRLTDVCTSVSKLQLKTFIVNIHKTIIR